MTGKSGDWITLLGTSIEALAAEGYARKVIGGLAWAEGPAEVSNGVWVFSDIPNNRLYSWQVGATPTVLQEPSDFANGNFRMRNGSLLTCHHGTRSVVQTALDGTRRTMCDRFAGVRLNSPNDVVEAIDGSIWFTDPTYGILTDIEGYRAPSEQSANRVYRLGPDGALSAEVDQLVQPNGLTFSPRGDLLYVADSGAEMGPEIGFDLARPHHIWVFRLNDAGHVASGRQLAAVGSGVPDGLRCDADGNIWAATGTGLECFTADGERLGLLGTAEVASNLCFSDDRQSMLVTLATSVWLLNL